MASDQDLLERLDAVVPARPFEVPTDRVVGEARRRRRIQRGLVAAGVVALVTVAYLGPVRPDGATIAGFTVFESGGRSFIGMVIPSTSMEPTFGPGDIAAVDVDAFATAEPRRGDVVVFPDADPQRGCQVLFVKRVVGVAGDTVEEIDGAIYVNGDPVDVPAPERRGNLGPWTVEPGHLFVVGDHLANSMDSRYEGFGQVSVSNLIGRVDLGTHLERADIPAPPACIASAPATSNG